MAYKFATGSVYRGDIYHENDAEKNTYLDWSDNAIGLVAGGTSVLVLSGTDPIVAIGGQPSPNFALDIPVSASTVRMGQLELGAWPNSTGYAFVGHSFQDHHGSNAHLRYNILLTANGSISLNSLTGQDMYFRIGTVIKAGIDSNGFFGIGPNAGHSSGFTPSAQLHVSSSDDEMAFLCHDAQQNPVLAVTGSGRVGIGTDDPTSTFEVSGSQAGNYTSITGNRTVDETDYIIDYTGDGNATITLPDVSGITGRMYHIISHAQGELDALTITGSGGQFQGPNLQDDSDSIDIDGWTPQSITVVSTGDNWFILTDNRSQGE